MRELEGLCALLRPLGVGPMGLDESIDRDRLRLILSEPALPPDESSSRWHSVLFRFRLAARSIDEGCTARIDRGDFRSIWLLAGDQEGVTWSGRGLKLAAPRRRAGGLKFGGACDGWPSRSIDFASGLIERSEWKENNAANKPGWTRQACVSGGPSLGASVMGLWTATGIDESGQEPSNYLAQIGPVQERNPPSTRQNWIPQQRPFSLAPLKLGAAAAAAAEPSNQSRCSLLN